jgi:SAM-dependent methyltransferase
LSDSRKDPLRRPAGPEAGQQLAEIMARLAAAPHPPVVGGQEFQIPWSDPEFSRRVLAVHLDPDTHMASRRPEIINRHAQWLTDRLTEAGLKPATTHILDVGCGPGLYLFDLAARGFQTSGFDFSPAAVQWAREQALHRGLDCRFVEMDLTCLPPDFEDGLGPADAVTFWFGEFHSFDERQARDFLPRLAGCLRPGGLFFLEYQPLDLFVQEDATQWQWCDTSLFCDRPHLWLEEFAWDADRSCEVHVHWILEADSGKLNRYVQRHQAWTDAQLTELLADAGLVDPVFYPPITGVAEEFEFPLVVTRRKEA